MHTPSLKKRLEIGRQFKPLLRPLPLVSKHSQPLKGRTHFPNNLFRELSSFNATLPKPPSFSTRLRATGPLLHYYSNTPKIHHQRAPGKGIADHIKCLCNCYFFITAPLNPALFYARFSESCWTGAVKRGRAGGWI